MKKISNRTFAALGLAGACATAVLWSQTPTGAPPLVAAINGGGSGAATGAAPAASVHAPVRTLAAVAPTPRNPA